MSHIWHMKCSKCCALTEEGVNHGREALSELIRHADEIFALEQRLSGIRIGEIRTDLYQLLDLDFLREHHEHGVLLRDEYGHEETVLVNSASDVQGGVAAAGAAPCCGARERTDASRDGSYMEK